MQGGTPRRDPLSYSPIYYIFFESLNVGFRADG